jgi:hypothetical protein
MFPTEKNRATMCNLARCGVRPYPYLEWSGGLGVAACVRAVRLSSHSEVGQPLKDIIRLYPSSKETFTDGASLNFRLARHLYITSRMQMA